VVSWRSVKQGTGPTPQDRIRHAKDTGLGRIPPREFKINQAWLMAGSIGGEMVVDNSPVCPSGRPRVAAQRCPCEAPPDQP